jgi:hypothetical protein
VAKIVGAKTESDVGLSENPMSVRFECGTCEYFRRGTCDNQNPKLKGRKVESAWCCNLYDHDGMRVIV